MRALIEDVGCSVAVKAEQKGLELITFLSPDIPSRLMGDPTRLRQILTNLTGNALKFTEQGEIFVKAELDANDNDRLKIRFEISDYSECQN